MQAPAEPTIHSRGRRRFGRPRLLIVGCGEIGLQIVARVRDRFRVIGLISQAARAGEVRAAGAVPLVANLDTRGALRRVRRLAKWLIHLAPPAPAGTGDPRSLRLRCACGGTVGRVVYVSTTGVYGDRAGALLDETARPLPSTDRARRRVAAERILRRRPMFARVLRVPGIYAADRLPLERLRAGTPALAPEDDVFSSHIHADDLVRLCLAALWRGRPARVYHAVDDTRLKMGEYFDLVADRFALPRPPRLPRARLQAAVSATQYSFMAESRRLSNTRIKRELRVRLRYPTVAGALRAIAPTPALPR